MKQATVRELRYEFPKIEAWLEGGEEIVITKHSRPVARIVAEDSVAKPLPPLPDFRARLKKTWGDRVFSQEEIDEMRALETEEP